MAWLWKECLYWKSDEFNQSYDGSFGWIYYITGWEIYGRCILPAAGGWKRRSHDPSAWRGLNSKICKSQIHRIFTKSYCWLLHLLFIRCYQCLNARSYSRPETCVWFQSLDNRRLLHVPSTRWFYINYIRVQRLVKIKILTAFFETPGAQL